jgi:uncharacterized protein (DUF433 family)
LAYVNKKERAKVNTAIKYYKRRQKAKEITQFQ